MLSGTLLLDPRLPVVVPVPSITPFIKMLWCPEMKVTMTLRHVPFPGDVALVTAMVVEYGIHVIFAVAGLDPLSAMILVEKLPLD